MIDENAKIIWAYMKMHQSLKRCDAIFVLGSRDERVAEYGAELFLRGYGDFLIISGGAAHSNDLLATHWTEATEADHFASIAIKMGVPKQKIIIENRATNTGENINFTYDLLQNLGIKLNSILLVQKPYMERRAYATFAKQWPNKDTKFIVSSPQIDYFEYFNDLQPKEQIINIMVGDLQRVKECPKLGYQIEQKIPSSVWRAYGQLVRQGYNKHLVI
ncbi:MAG: YdcF family protein [Candidatus Woesebacteria bacterium]|jgi:uncharacterized SAM-binding protein YcdF (DUF218 family)